MTDSVSTLLTGFGRTAGTAAGVVTPKLPDVAAAVLGAPVRGTLARGLGRAYGDAAQNAGGSVIDTQQLQGVVVDHELGVVRADAGVVLGDLMRVVVPHGWFVPVTPGTQFVTVGGAIAADVHGKNHHQDGSFGDHLIDLELVDGTGITHTLHPGDPAFEATCGGLGLTGVITAATLQLIPIETADIRTDIERMSDLDTLMARLADSDDDYRYSVAWIDLVTGGKALGRGVLERGDHATRAENASDSPLAVADGRTVNAPPWVPSGLLNRVSARAFNELWFRKSPAEATRIVPYSTFFHPLDRLAGWNRLYGDGGFLQYQFVVPLGQERALQRAVELIAGAKSPVLLAVLKRLGPGRGLLAFPQAGWTLALDLPARWDGLREVVDALDVLVAEAGGRVYLVKDARLRPEMLPLMYPELEAWRTIRSGLDPDGRFQSDLSRRIGLVEPRA